MRDPEAWRSALQGVAGSLSDHGLRTVAAMASPVLGPAGNVEFFVLANGEPDGAAADLDGAVAEGFEIRERGRA